MSLPMTDHSRADSNSLDNEKETSTLHERLANAWLSEWNEVIPSDPIKGVNLIRELLKVLEDHEWSEKDRFGIHMALEEAIMNAIKHGNQRDPSKSVTVLAKLSDKQFYINVKDEGPGFNPEDVPDPTLDDNLTKPSGRGLMLMKVYMDEVLYSEKGTRVELLKSRDT